MNFVGTIDAVLLIFLFYNIILFDVNKSWLYCSYVVVNNVFAFVHSSHVALERPRCCSWGTKRTEKVLISRHWVLVLTVFKALIVDIIMLSHHSSAWQPMSHSDHCCRMLPESLQNDYKSFSFILPSLRWVLMQVFAVLYIFSKPGCSCLINVLLVYAFNLAVNIIKTLPRWFIRATVR